jgi:murein DD-endopeptidase MepM/ murein hydrolase activator NlpD
MTSTWTRTLATTLATAVIGAGMLTPGAASAEVGSSGRRMVDHRVRPGETATGLAVRFHAWTAELIAHNHLDRAGHLRVGQHLEIPVVLAALPHRHRGHPHRHRHGARHHHGATHPRHHRSGDPSRAVVRRVVARAAARRGVDPQLALAISWQESGWQMDRRSSAGAIGAMQVLPGTAAWMSLYEGRRLHPAYYQGLGAVRDHGIYAQSRPYVRNVLALRHRLEAGHKPA